MGKELQTPYFLVDEGLLRKNLEILRRVSEEAGCKILLAQKAFSCFYEYPLIGRYLDGTTASGLYEARLGKEEMGKENHVFAPAYKDADIKELGEQLGELQRVCRDWGRERQQCKDLPDVSRHRSNYGYAEDCFWCCTNFKDL